MDVAGERGVIDLGISKESSLAEAWTGRRRRRHRLTHLNEIEEVLVIQRQKRKEADDIALWKGKNNVFKENFSTKDTWNYVRATSLMVPWHKGVWFSHATPKYSFCSWLAIQDRLSTGERLDKWKGSATGNCVFCMNNMETRDHLFFSCSYVSTIWAALTKSLWKNRYTTGWSQILAHISDASLNRIEGFLIRYVFQATIYTVWREGNGRHGEAPNSSTQLIGWIDKQVRNQITTIRRMGDRRYDAAFQVWLQAQS